MSPAKKAAAAKPKPLPGKLTARQTDRTGEWVWRWVSPHGTPHLGVQLFGTEKAALAAGRRFARKQLSRNAVEIAEGDA